MNENLPDDILDMLLDAEHRSEPEQSVAQGTLAQEGRRIRVIQVAGRLFNEVAYKPIDKLTHQHLLFHGILRLQGHRSAYSYLYLGERISHEKSLYFSARSAKNY
ncbi:hypothetical protein Bhyg_06815 [Pseudolycoriella hygida]|uniref:Uncharacterized protein n=1 Tax=Pseudolycoriella hygida TaxID=35572 RepID=A0A9Q0N1I6_9DIPT|nr:hypothetical protein Bhyg_06815 [Pseudolycoriella hygida]